MALARKTKIPPVMIPPRKTGIPFAVLQRMTPRKKFIPKVPANFVPSGSPPQFIYSRLR